MACYFPMFLSSFCTPPQMTTFIPLKQRYKTTIQPKLQKELRLDNIHQAPKLVKVTVNRGLGEAVQNSKAWKDPRLRLPRSRVRSR